MLHLLQVFKSATVYSKINYTAENRKKASVLFKIFKSSTGFVKDNVLYLPLEYKKPLLAKTPELILLVDFLENYPDYTFQYARQNTKPYILINNTEVLTAFELFKIRKLNDACFEIFFEYEKNAFFIGIPKRNSHKIGEIRPDNSLRYLINGKSDFTMSGRKQRAFYEYEYVFGELQTVHTIEFCDAAKVQISKTVMQKNIKTIDERKLLK